MGSRGHLEVAGHEDGHDGEAAKAHPQGAAVELPGGALVVGPGRRQVGQRRPVLGRAHACCVRYEVRLHPRRRAAATCRQHPHHLFGIFIKPR